MRIHQRLLDLSLSAVAALEPGSSRLRGRAAKPSEAQSVLLLEYILPLGCCVHLTPLFEAIKRHRPEVVLSVATRGLGASLLRHHPAIDHLLQTPDALQTTFAAARALRRELKTRRIQPDCVLTGASDRRSRIALTGLLATRAWRGGFTLAKSLYARPLAYNYDLSLIQNNLRLAELLGAHPGPTEPAIFFSPADLAAADALLREVNPNRRPVAIFVTQGSGLQRTAWHTDRYAEVIRYAHGKGLQVLYVGTHAESPTIEEIRQEAGGIGISLAGRTTVTQLAALLAASDYVVSLDTGTMHLARSVGTPMVVLAPTWQPAIEWMPLGLEQVRILRGPDRKDIPPDYKLDEITAPAVVHALTELLELYPASEAERRARTERRVSAVDHWHVDHWQAHNRS